MSFADILRKVKGAPELKAVGDDVHSIRKTQKGELLLEFKRSTEATMVHQANIKSILSEEIEVKTLTEEVTLELRYLNEITTKEEIITAWKEQIGAIQPSAIKTIRSAPGGTRTAIIVIPKMQAGKAEEVGKLRVGWTVCRLLKKVTPRRCYKCFDFGHVARNCQSTKDWSKHCYKCGEQDHLAKACQEALTVFSVEMTKILTQTILREDRNALTTCLPEGGY
ncbi:uncharacterized protein LOC119664510 [Teleopsis dalmanni]|uniref:uncharacterized protein LOC119664510 n=1 Tax=Teleopsis dalmanni TaxID=139649 RepID=UPI0018CE5885|nr:uncharacterized protein LOC119664510 [Teleopsis dalmanni]